MPTIVERLRAMVKGDAGKVVAAAPPVLGAMLSPQAAGLGIYVAGLTVQAEDTILSGKGGGSYLIYDNVLSNPQAFSTFQQRRRAVVSRPWEVEPGADDAASIAAADHLREQIAALDWDRITDGMLFGLWYGFQPGECVFELKDGKVVLADVVCHNRNRFRFDAFGGLKLVDSYYGLSNLPERKFWLFRAGQMHDYDWYGRGLGHWCYWPAWFARNGERFWAVFLEKFAMPTAVGKIPGGAGAGENAEYKAQRAMMLETLSAISSEAAVVMPEDFSVELLEAMRSGAAEYGKFLERQDASIAKIVLSQTMTTDDGSSLSQSATHMTVRNEVAKGDADLLSSSFMSGPAAWLTEWNWPGAKVPKVYRRMEEEEDLDAVADRDTKLFALGWQRSEESFKETFGEFYERKPAPEPVAGGFDITTPEGQAAAKAAKADKALAFLAGEPRPLYVARKVENAAEILRWAKGQGIANLVAPDDMHVTVAYSRAPVDWLSVRQPGGLSQDDRDGKVYVAPGGPRQVDRFDNDGPLVLAFASTELQWRFEDIMAAGASYDHDAYRPHITLSYDPGPVDVAALEVWQGRIVLGPEVFEELDTGDAAPRLPSFAADDADAIEAMIGKMSGVAGPAMAALIGPMRKALRGATSPEDAKARLVAAFADMDDAPLAELIARGELALGGAQLIGVDPGRVA